MTENEKIVRAAYETAERRDLEAFIDCFTPDGTLTDQSTAVTYQGRDVAKTVDVYARAFPDMHRELFRLFEVGDTIIVELALRGTHKGPLALPSGTVEPTGNVSTRLAAMSSGFETARSSHSTATPRAPL